MKNCSSSRATKIPEANPAPCLKRLIFEDMTDFRNQLKKEIRQLPNSRYPRLRH